MRVGTPDARRGRRRRRRRPPHRAGTRTAPPAATSSIDAAVARDQAARRRVGMDQIAADARTSKPVIYRYFADKTDLYRAVDASAWSARSSPRCAR